MLSKWEIVVFIPFVWTSIIICLVAGMGWVKFCGHMRKPFTLTLYINEVGPLNFIRSLCEN
jgi:hypothetical protein